MLYLTPWRKDFKYFLKYQLGDLTKKETVDKLIECTFSRKRLPGLTAPFWYYDIEKADDPKLREIIRQRILASDRSLESIFKAFVEEITHFKGYERPCMKFPVYINHAPKLLKWYPQCKIIHIIRDPRATAISRTNDPGGTQYKLKKYPYLSYFIKRIMILFVIVQYIWSSKLHIQYKKYKNYTLFCYEDLLNNPEEIIKQLCDFTEIEFVPEMLHPKAGQASSVTGKKHSGFDKNAAFRWEKVISPFAKSVITLLTKSSMKRFGYFPEKYK